MYFVVQALTFGILVLAANTSYQGFPRLAAVLARDRFFPRQFVNLGDRLVYSNGIIVLAGIASLLIWVFHANVISLIHLYVIGVFTAFTLSQAGMVRYWLRRKERGWRKSAFINGFGAAATGVVTVLVIQAKFTAGAWMVVVAIPALIALLSRRQPPLPDRHPAPAGGHGGGQGILGCDEQGRSLRRRLSIPRRSSPPGTRSRSPGTTITRSGSRTVAAARTREAAGGTSPAAARVSSRCRRSSGPRTPFSTTCGRSRAESRTSSPSSSPRSFERPSLLSAVVRRRTTFSLKLRLLSEPGIVITNVTAVSGVKTPAPEPKRVVARVLVSEVHASSVRAVNYARTLRLADTKAVFFAFDADEAKRIGRDWEREGLGMPLEIVEAPFRDLGDPLLHYLRELTADPDVAVSVLMPELIFSGSRKLLHNQRALYIKRLLLFEPRVLLSSVPYHLP